MTNYVNGIHVEVSYFEDVSGDLRRLIVLYCETSVATQIDQDVS